MTYRHDPDQMSLFPRCPMCSGHPVALGQCSPGESIFRCRQCAWTFQAEDSSRQTEDTIATNH